MESKTKEMTFESVQADQRYNKVAPESIDRSGDDEMQNTVATKWEATTEEWPSSSGNVKSQTYFDMRKQEVIFADSKEANWGWDNPDYPKWNDFLSSALLVYRLMCLWFAPPRVFDGYKMVWSLTIKHKATGKLLTFSEWKGSAGFWLPENTHTELDDTFKSDLKELLEFLISDQIAHPYDGCTAGQIA